MASAYPPFKTPSYQPTLRVAFFFGALVALVDDAVFGVSQMFLSSFTDSFELLFAPSKIVELFSLGVAFPPDTSFREAESAVADKEEPLARAGNSMRD